MKRIVCLSCVLLQSVFLFAQSEVTVNDFSIPKKATLDFAALPDLPEAKIISLAPSPLNETRSKKVELDRQRKIFIASPNAVGLNKAAGTAPQVTRSFQANGTQGTPNDNDLAISNGNVIASVVNTNINILNDTGKFLFSRTLAVIAQSLGKLDRTFDPKVIYDPENDRFILVFLQGSTSVDTRIMIGFTQTNDPTGKWNFYQVPGNITGDSSWSDYPIIALSKNDLFVTVNRVKDNTPWQTGFLESYIWQIDKQTGFKGDSLKSRCYNNIKFNGKSIWSICPAKGGSKLYGPGIFLISVRPSDLSNDTVFLHSINNSLASGSAQFQTRVFKTSIPYGLQPNAIQPNGKKLQTNDARILSAMYEDGMIYYTGNTIDPQKFSPSVYFGRIENIWSTPIVTGKIISYDTLDIAYPSIAYAGTGINGDHSCMITFSHVSPNQNPGTSVVYIDRNYNVSPPVFVKQGLQSIVLIGDSVERWGDYTGIQMKYNESGVCWLNGSYGDNNRNNNTWIGRIKTTDPLLSVHENALENGSFKLFPNPAVEQVQVEFESKEKVQVNIELYNLQGQQLMVLNRDWVKPGLNRLSMDISKLNNGIYFVNLISNEKVVFSHRLVVAH